MQLALHMHLFLIQITPSEQISTHAGAEGLSIENLTR
jgi:hypothetical protein